LAERCNRQSAPRAEKPEGALPPLVQELFPALGVYLLAVGRRTVMRAQLSSLRTLSIVAIAVGSASVATAANAGPRLGLGGVFGLVAGPLHVITHGAIGGTPAPHSRHRASALAAHNTPEVARSTPEVTRTPASATGSSRQANLEPPRTGSPPPQPAPAWPTASPSVYEDLLGYILWPRDYADRLWTHGYNDIMSAMLAPPAAAAVTDTAASMIATGMCSTQARELADKPIARIAETIELTGDQRLALDELRTALGQAIDRGRAVVCGTASSTAADRLKRMLDGLWTMWDTTILVRAPLEAFYNSLTPAQKEQWAGGDSTDTNAGGVCTDQRNADWPADRIQTAIGASEQQRLDLAALRQQASELASFLATSCPHEAETTPLRRLGAVSDRMNALMYVVMNMNPVFNAFYGSLDDRQKKQFDKNP
jgi:hypothetical protein